LQREREVGAAALERTDALGQMIGQPQVVVVEQRDVAPARQANAFVGRPRLIADALELDVAYARIGERGDDVRRVVGAAVADDEQLPVAARLRQYRAYRVPDDVAAVVRRDDDRHRGVGGCGHRRGSVVHRGILPNGDQAPGRCDEPLELNLPPTRAPTRMHLRRLTARLIALGALVAAVLATPLAAAQQPRTLLVLGDSISAAYGLAPGSGWVDLLARRLAAENLAYRVVNASISGDTTAGGRARLPALLQQHRPAVVVVELGGNDGLRGGDLKAMRANLDAIVTAAQKAGAKVLIAAMRMPPNYGAAYVREFESAFTAVARERKAALVPFIFDGFGEKTDMFQPDRIHPTAAAQQAILDNVWPQLAPLLK
jgi:acyl-CoA thioesterase-1